MTDETRLRERLSARIESYDRRDAARVVGLVVLVTVVLPFVVFAVPQAVGAEHSYVVLSGSMEPAISPGDVIVVNDVPPEAVSEGDVITFGGGGGEPTTTHRVIDVDESGGEPVFRTQGDNNEAPDSAPVPASAVTGRVMELPALGAGSTLFVIPYIGHVIEFSNTTAGFLALVVTPLALLVASELWAAFGREDGDESAGDAPERSGATGEQPVPDDETAVTVSAWQVTGAAALLTAVAAIAGWRTYETQQSAWAVVAAGSAVSAVLLVAFAVAADPDEPTSGDGTQRAAGAGDAESEFETAGGAERTVDGDLSEILYRRGQVEVESLATLREMATERQSHVIRDESTGTHALLDDGVAYVVMGTASRDGARNGAGDGEGPQSIADLTEAVADGGDDTDRTADPDESTPPAGPDGDEDATEGSCAAESGTRGDRDGADAGRSDRDLERTDPLIGAPETPGDDDAD